MDLLPVEVNQRIIDYLPDLTTLYALIRASPLHNVILHQCVRKKHRTLRKLLLRALDLSLIPLAIRTCEAGNVNNIFSHQQDWMSAAGPGRCASCSHKIKYRKRRWKRLRKFTKKPLAYDMARQPTWLRSKNRNRLREPEELEDPQVVRRLCRLTMIVDWFVDDYVRNARSFVKDFKREHQKVYYRPNKEGKDGAREAKEDGEKKGEAELEDSQYVKNMNLPETLSEVERWRIQRAFFFFEFRRRLLGGLDRYEWHDYRSCIVYNHPRTLFLTNYQKLELSSVHEYLIARMASIYKEIEKLSTSRSEMVAEFGNDNDNESPNAPMVITNSCMGPSALPRFIPNPIHERHQKDERRTLAFLAEIGLPFCKRFFNMNVKQQKGIIHQYSSSWCHNVVGNTFADICYRCSSNVHPKSREMQIRGYELLIAKHHKLPRNTSTSDLERCGFFFWDSVNDYTTGGKACGRPCVEHIIYYSDEDSDPDCEIDETPCRSVRRNEIDRFIEEMDY